MTATTTNVAQVKLNVMNQSQYNSATKNPTELYMVTDAQLNYNDLTNKPVVDQTYSGVSTNAQSGVAVKSAIDAAISSVYKAAGSIAFASLPTPASTNEGYVYNVTDAFTTTSDFVEGAGKSYPAGTNVVTVNTGSSTYKFDTLTGAFQPLLVSGTNIKTINNESVLGNGNISISAPTYTAGTGIDITNNTISVDSVTPTEVTLATVATTGAYSDLSGIPTTFTGADGTNAGTTGLVPAPTATDNTKFLKGDGTWATVSGGGSSYTAGTGIDITSNVISVTSPTLINKSTNRNQAIGIGGGAGDYGVVLGTNAYSGSESISIGQASTSSNGASVSIGTSAGSTGTSSVAIGYKAKANSNYAIQLGQGTNSEANSFYVSTAGAAANWKMLGSDGKIPSGRLPIATSVSSSSTNDETVGAKLFYNTCGDIETLINAL